MWTQTAGTTVSLIGDDTATPSFTGPSVEPGGEILIFSLVVSDGKDVSMVDTVGISVFDVPPMPTVHVANLEYDTSGKNNWTGKVWITVEYEGNSGLVDGARITSYNVCYTKLLRLTQINFWLQKNCHETF